MHLAPGSAVSLATGWMTKTAEAAGWAMMPGRCYLPAHTQKAISRHSTAGTRTRTSILDFL